MNSHTDVIRPLEIIPHIFKQIEMRVLNKGSLMGISSGFYDLDNYLSGFQKSNFIVIAGRPSIGKSSFCLNIVNHLALKEKKPVLYFTLESTKEDLITKMICAEAEIDAQRIRCGELNQQDFQKLDRIKKLLGDSPIFINDNANVSIEEIRSISYCLDDELEGTLGLIVVDYIQMVKGFTENRYSDVARISRELKILAKQLKVPVIGISQLSRSVENRIDKCPILMDLRDSGTLEEDADVVMFIYRDEYYNPETDRPGIADIIIAKQRNGPVGTVSLIFRNNITRFLNPLDMKPSVF